MNWLFERFVYGRNAGKTDVGGEQPTWFGGREHQEYRKR